MPQPEPQAKPTRKGGLRALAGLLLAMLRQRCPRCHKGRMFRGIITANDPCPVCGLIFQREEGSYLGAMYVSYFLSSAIIGVFFLAVSSWLPSWDGPLIGLLPIALYLPFVPAVFRYSRVVWVYLDRVGDFTDTLAGPYEKERLRQLAEGDGDGPTTATTAPTNRQQPT
jgi:uncharacterized protein (DUF983 family)